MNKKMISGMLLSAFLAAPVSADLFMVKTNSGPGFTSAAEAIEVLEKGIVPTFDALAELQKQDKLIFAGLPVGSRKMVLIVEAKSHDAVDRMLRDLPAWGVLSWKVTPLQSLDGRATMEREIIKKLKAGD